MKLLLDHNCSPKIARALHALVEPVHEVRHLREKFAPATTDQDWVKALSFERGWAIATLDRRIRKRPHEREAWRRSRLVLFALEPAWGGETMNPMLQTARMIQWWPRWVQIFEEVEPPAAFLVPLRASSKLKQLRS
ncbi:MAG: hypothetical protein ACLFTG_14345 [Alphaproteobacteria bacterium]